MNAMLTSGACTGLCCQVSAEWLPRMAGTHFNDHHICPTAGTANVMDMGHVSTYGTCCQDGQEAEVVGREGMV